MSSPFAAERIADPSFYANPADVDAVLSELRRTSPVHWTEPEGYRPFWTVTKHADIREVGRQSATFLNEPRAVLVTTAAEEAFKAHAGSRHPVRSLVRMDDPDHKALRAITSQWFQSGALQARQAQIADLAREVVDAMRDGGGACDFARTVANPFPLRVIMSVLGLPREYEPVMLRLTQELFGPQDNDTNRAAAARTSYVDTVDDFNRFFAALTEQRRREPQADLASVIANSRPGGQPITQRDANGYYITVATAGHDTTSSTIAGGMLALVRNPDQLERLRSDLSLLPSAVDEMLRWVTPIRHFMRTATVDYELRGRTVRAGDDLFLAYPSGNRDEDVFPDPFVFDIGRRPNAHLAFGFGSHVCLGMFLAKMEVQAFFRELLPRLAWIELDGEPAWVGTNFVQAMKRLPVRYAFLS